MDPLKRNVRKIESDNVIFEKRIIARVDREVKETIDLFESAINTLRKDFDTNLRAMQKYRARDKTENDMRHVRNEETMEKHRGMFEDYADHF